MVSMEAVQRLLTSAPPCSCYTCGAHRGHLGNVPNAEEPMR